MRSSTTVTITTRAQLRACAALVGLLEDRADRTYLVKKVTPAGGTLRGDFERLLQLKFDSLFAAHGSFLPAGAHVAVEAAVRKAFG
jgi:hypothetical protein